MNHSVFKLPTECGFMADTIGLGQEMCKSSPDRPVSVAREPKEGTGQEAKTVFPQDA